MSILYYPVQRKNPQKPDDPQKFYLQAVKRGNLAFEDLIVRATEDTTLDPDELRMSLNRAFKKAEESLSDGFTVSFGDLGHIQPSITSEGTEKEEDARPDKIKRLRLNFVFGKRIRDFMQTVGFEKGKIDSNP